MAPVADVLSKGQFAQLKNVTPGRVSQWISEKKIFGEALVGEGRFARIRVAVANDQLRQTLNLGQMLGNGIATDLTVEDDDLPLDPAAVAESAPKRNTVDEQLRQARLEELQRRNRQAEREELAERGIYTPTDDARAGMTQVAAGMMAVFEGGLADIAQAIAAKFSLPERDVLHLVRQEFRTIRGKAAEAARRKAQALEAIVEHDPAATQDPAQAAA